MWKVHLLSLLLIYTLLATGCLSQKLPEQYLGQKIYFGSGGGFSGNVTTFCLLANGKLFKKESIYEKPFELIKRIDFQETEQLFTNLEILNLKKIQYNKPGNLYKYIKFSEEEIGLVWSDQNNDIPQGAQLFYKILNSKIK